MSAPSISNKYQLLNNIEFPDDLRKLAIHHLPEVCRELRAYLLETVSGCGGHFGAGLGAVEITVALHYVFNTPQDKLIWDVGHQTYPHKILTGRKHKLKTIRKKGGLSPFPKRSESEYDTFGVGHSSTSISAAAGMALAFRHQQIQHNVVAIIGDGGMTAGMAYEALNHIGSEMANVLIILNDNNMSISPNVGAMTNYLTRIVSSSLYTSIMKGGKKLLQPVPPLKKFAHKTKEQLKHLIVPGILFEELGVHYYGPINGHDVLSLVKTLENLKKQKTPRLLHIITKKGKGYLPAEQDPVKYHAVSTFDPKIGIQSNIPASPPGPTYSEVFGKWICDMASKNDSLVAITPAMREGSGLVEFEKKFPKRYFDVGIAEQHAVTLAAGFACGNLKPVVAIYSTFLQRSYDQLIHDVAIQNLPILFAVDRAGVVGADGGTHAGSFDLSFLRCIPNLIIMAPCDENQTRKMLSTAFSYDGPSIVRYPRGRGPGALIDPGFTTVEIGKANQLQHGDGCAIFALGSTVEAAKQVADKLNMGIFDMRFVKPLDIETIISAANEYDYLVTVEENVTAGGFGSAINECLAQNNITKPILNLGLPDYFQEHGSQEDLLEEAGLTAHYLQQKIYKFTQTHISNIPL